MNGGKLFIVNFSCLREVIIVFWFCFCGCCMVFFVLLSGIFFLKKVVVSCFCCFCYVDYFDKSFGVDGFWSGYVLYKW